MSSTPQEPKGPYADDLARIEDIKASNPDNIMAKVFDPSYFNSLEDDQKKRLLKCLKSGMDNPDSSMGCYANEVGDYDEFKPFFKRALEEYHKVNLTDKQHTNNWSLEGVEGLPEDGKLDLSTFGLGPLSMRVRVGRNLSKFPLPASMSRDQRVDLEKEMGAVFAKLIADEKYGGAYYSITPQHENFINEEKYQDLVKDHIMFKDMSNDQYLLSAGIAKHWPYGRGCYVSEDRKFIIWVGEEDHLRIMCMQVGTMLNDVFDRLKGAIDVVEELIDGGCAKSADYGVVTSCPTNIGTGMRASVHIQLPNLTREEGEAGAKKIGKPLGLSVRGTGGEHTPIGVDGTVDISPSARFCISEAEIITALYLGIEKLVEAEAAAAPSAADLVAKIKKVKAENPDNIMAACFDEEYFNGLEDEVLQARLLKCCASGIWNPDSQMGCYANQPDDYDQFQPFFKQVLSKYHGVDLDATKHECSWKFDKTIEGLPESKVLDLEALGLPALSMRVRTGRNLNAFPLPASMTLQDRLDMENELYTRVFTQLAKDKRYGGGYRSITPGHPCEISGADYKALVAEHLMFKDMSADRYLVAAGIAAHWPHGRGCYVSEDREFIVWVGEEDHLRIMCMKKGTVINEVFDRLKVVVEMIEKKVRKGCAKSADYGVVTSCPTNIGTGMRASVHIQLPNLTADGTDAKAKEIAKQFGLSVRGMGGEHTPIGADGTVDISPSARFCIKEAQIVTNLYNGLKSLKEAEDALSAGGVGEAKVEDVAVEESKK